MAATKRPNTRRPTASTARSGPGVEVHAGGQLGCPCGSHGIVDLEVELQPVGTRGRSGRPDCGSGRSRRGARRRRGCRRCRRASGPTGMHAASGPRTGSRRPASLRTTSPTPTSGSAAAYTAAPSAAANCCAPRQIPSTATSSSTARANHCRSVASHGYATSSCTPMAPPMTTAPPTACGFGSSSPRSSAYDVHVDTGAGEDLCEQAGPLVRRVLGHHPGARRAPARWPGTLAPHDDQGVATTWNTSARRPSVRPA